MTSTPTTTPAVDTDDSATRVGPMHQAFADFLNAEHGANGITAEQVFLVTSKRKAFRSTDAYRVGVKTAQAQAKATAEAEKAQRAADREAERQRKAEEKAAAKAAAEQVPTAPVEDKAPAAKVPAAKPAAKKPAAAKTTPTKTA